MSEAKGRIVAGALAPHPPHLVYAENPPQNTRPMLSRVKVRAPNRQMVGVANTTVDEPVSLPVTWISFAPPDQLEPFAASKAMTSSRSTRSQALQ